MIGAGVGDGVRICPKRRTVVNSNGNAELHIQHADGPRYTLRFKGVPEWWETCDTTSEMSSTFISTLNWYVLYHRVLCR